MQMNTFWLTVVSGLLVVSTAHAFDFARVAESQEVGERVSPIRYWDSVPAEQGDTVSHYCQAFLRERPVAGVGIYDCVDLVSPLNGITSIGEYRNVRVGQLLWLPSPRNTATDMAARQTARAAQADSTAAGQVLANNPLGMARELLQALERLDDTDARLTAVETTMVKTADVPMLLDRALHESTLLAEIRSVDREAMETYVAEQLAARPQVTGLTEAAVNRLITEALAAADVSSTSSEQVTAMVAAALADYEDRLTAVEQQSTDAQSGVIDLGNRVGDLESSIDDRFTAVDERFNQLNSPTTESNSPSQYEGLVMFGGLLLGAMAFLGVLGLWWTKSSNKDFRNIQDQVNDEGSGLAAAHTKVEALQTKVGDTITKADKAHGLATRALQEARVATNLGLPDGWSLIGDLPSEHDVRSLNNGDSITLRFLHDTKGERKAIFTMATGSIQGPDGNMVDGLLVTGISGLVKPIAVKLNNMIGKVRNGINSNKFVGVDADGKTNGPTSAVA